MNKTITINNKDYFYMIDNEFRGATIKCEQFDILPRALSLLKDSNIFEEELIPYIIEGYYYQTPELKQYFTIIRNLQENKKLFNKVKNTDDLKYIKKILGSTLYGTEKSGTLLPKMKDIMTLCMSDNGVFPQNRHHVWTIPKIVDNLPNYFTNNPNLVELAYMTREVECLVAGCETNILYREIATVSGCSETVTAKPPVIIWNVSEELQILGEKLVDKFNNVYQTNIMKPNKYNVSWFNRFSKLPRVARLGYQSDTKENYYWILDKNGNVYDKYDTNKITTENLQ